MARIFFIAESVKQKAIEMINHSDLYIIPGDHRLS
ncbi:hypothetical protein FHW36_106214 [Chitinophaga polysaccharea]|uniref:Uncharacterized protein n=1 Tax=Chitinophaga polysaccharea TaxID=1293035 RepID=A0A561PLL7_9BACT|nr:hypothetical protein FHW36_106214 [Chitinophaga polysaccharea]